jgi:uncharacterized protein YdeI (YjbR/CyaY-like superfamily)
MADANETLYFKKPGNWRGWLEKNHSSKKEVWLTFYKKHTGKPSLSLDEAVEEALCYGWIDSTLKRIDDERYILRFSPRRRGSVWATSNLERIESLKKQGKMTKAGLGSLKDMKLDPVASTRELVVPEEIERALRSNGKAWREFESLPPSHKKQYVWWIASAKKEETRKKRIEKTIEMLEMGRRF